MMQVILIRHGKAEDAAEWAREHSTDVKRPLTRKGEREMADAAEGLAELVETIDVLASSPLTRAIQTAEIVGVAYGGLEIVVCDELKPGRKPELLMRWLRERGKAKVVAVVGHEPGLSRCAGYMLGGAAKSVVEMKKGGACLIKFEGEPAAGRGVMKWLMSGGQLKRQA